MGETSNRPPAGRDTLIAAGLTVGAILAGQVVAEASDQSKTPPGNIQQSETPDHMKPSVNDASPDGSNIKVGFPSKPPEPEAMPQSTATIGVSPETFAPTSSLNIEITPAPSPKPPVETLSPTSPPAPAETHKPSALPTASINTAVSKTPLPTASIDNAVSKTPDPLPTQTPVNK